MRRLKSLFIMAGILLAIGVGDVIYVRRNLDALIQGGFATLRTQLAPCSLEVGIVESGDWRTIVVHDIRLLSASGEEAFKARRLIARLTLRALLRGVGDEVIVEGATLRIHRDGEGRWNLPIGGGGATANGEVPFHRLRLKNTTISFVDDTLFPRGTEHTVWARDLAVDVERGGRLRIHRGEIDVEHLGRVRIHDLEFDARAGTLKGAAGVDEVEVEEALGGRLPRGFLSDLWDECRPEGRVALDVELDLDLRAEEVLRSVEGTVRMRGVRVQHEKFPYPVEDLAGAIRLLGDRLEIDLSGSFGDGDLDRLEGEVAFRGPGGSPTMDLHAEIQEVVIRPSLRRALEAAGIGKEVDSFDPGGSFGRVEVDLRRAGDGSGLQLSVRLMPRRIDVAYAGFPYRVENIHGGTLQIDVSFPPGVVPGKEPITVTIDGLHGRHGEGRIGGEGSWVRSDEGVAIDLGFLAEGADLGPDLEAAMTVLGSGVYDEWKKYAPSGPANVEVRLSKAPVAHRLDFRIETEFLGCTMRPQVLPYPLEEFRGRLTITREGFSLVGARARHAEGTIEAEGTGDPFQGVRPTRVHLAAHDLPLDDDLRRLLPDEIREAYDPQGWVHWEADLLKEAGSDKIELRSIVVRPRDVRIRYEDFPYPIEGVQGQVTIADGEILPILTARLPGGAEALLRGRIRGEKGPRDVDLQLSVVRLPLDDRLRWAIGPTTGGSPQEVKARPGLQAIWDMLDPGGTVDVDARIMRVDGGHTVVRGAARLVDATCRPSYFPLRVWGLDGTVSFDLDLDAGGVARGRLTLGEASGERPIEGVRGRTMVAAWGEILLAEEGPGIDLRIAARDLEIDRTLRSALPPEGRVQFDEFEPAGWADVDAAVRLEPGKEVAVDWEANLTGVRVRYRPFPFPVHDAEGVISAEGGVLRVRDVHGQGEYGDAVIALDGESREEGRFLSLSIRAERIPLIEEVRVLLPESLARTWEDLGLEGEADVDLRVTSDPRALLILGEGRTRDMAIRFGEGGLRFEELDSRLLAEAKVYRTKGDEGRVEMTGRLKDLSGSYRERPIEDLRADLRYTREAGEDAPGTMTYSGIRGKFVGGNITGRMDLALGADVEYAGRFRLRNGRLEQALAPLEESSKATGRLSARVVFEGRGADPEATRGEGEIRIRDGDFIDIPAIWIVRNFFDVKRTFDTMDIEFDLGPEGADTDMVLSSPYLSILARGTVAYDGMMDMIAVPEVMRPWVHGIPVIGWIWEFIKGTVMAVRVLGTLENPTVKYYPLSTWSKWLEFSGD